MADGLFPLMYWALGNGLAAGQWPGNGADLVTGGSPRFQLYDTKDGRVVAAAPLEQKFWEAFTAAIGLEPAFIDDSRDPAATTARVAEIIRTRPAEEWAPILDAADCCCSIMQDVQAALADPHFQARGVFAHVLTNEAGSQIPALPVPVSDRFRAPAGESLSAPALGAHNAEFAK